MEYWGMQMSSSSMERFFFLYKGREERKEMNTLNSQAVVQLENLISVLLRGYKIYLAKKLSVRKRTLSFRNDGMYCIWIPLLPKEFEESQKDHRFEGEKQILHHTKTLMASF